MKLPRSLHRRQALSLRIALRYLFSRKSHGAVNMVSAISAAAVAVAAAAMMIVLSVFNGFTQLAESKLSKLDPDFLLVPERGAYIPAADSLCAAIEGAGVVCASPQVDTQAFAVAPARRMGVTVRGMTSQGLMASGINSAIIDGAPTLMIDTPLMQQAGEPADSAARAMPAIMSVGAAVALNLRPSLGLDNFDIYVPRRLGRINPGNLAGAFRQSAFVVTSVYQLEQEEYDKNTILVPLEAAAGLLNLSPGEATSIAVTVDKTSGGDATRRALKELARDAGLKVLDRYEQQPHTYRMIAVEKWITFLMLAFILAIAAFNVVSTIYMMMLEKHDNMAILTAMGASRRMQNAIFVWLAWLIVAVGGVLGTIVGTLLSLLQQRFGLIKLSGVDPSMLSLSSYPVRVDGMDLLVTFVAVTAVAAIVTPLVYMIRRRES